MTGAGASSSQLSLSVMCADFALAEIGAGEARLRLARRHG